MSLELLVERFAPVFQACLEYGTTFDLECHPSERAMGDIASAGDYLAALDAAGFAKAAGFNFDCSHMEWQGVSGVDFIRAYGDRIHCAHIKGVQVIRGYTRNGLLGGHRPMGDKHNGWNFVTAGTARDATSTEELFVELNRAGFQRRRDDRMGRQRRRAARRRQAGLGQRAPRRPAPQRHAARRAAGGRVTRPIAQEFSSEIGFAVPRSAVVLPTTDPTPIFELFRGVHATELLTAAVGHFDLFSLLRTGPLSFAGPARRTGPGRAPADRAAGGTAGDGTGRKRPRARRPSDGRPTAFVRLGRRAPGAGRGLLRRRLFEPVGRQAGRRRDGRAAAHQPAGRRG